MTTLRFPIQAGDYARGGFASRAVKEQLRKLGADPAVIRRAMVAAYEAEMNVVIHSHGGELRASFSNGQLDVEVSDIGPGIPDIAQAMKEGWSTAPAEARELGFGAGMGLPNIERNADDFHIDSAVGRGTQVRFTIVLKAEDLYGRGDHSIEIVADRCRRSLRCVPACPTEAIRVFHGKPEVLDYLCIDCATCIDACPSATFRMRGDADESPAPRTGDDLIVTPESLVQCGPGATAGMVVSELLGRGWRSVHVSMAWLDKLNAAVAEYAQREAPARPVIAPGCPAVVNLVATRFPSLIAHVAPFLSPLEAMQTAFDAATTVFVVTCPAERTALRTQAEGAPPRTLTPNALQHAVRSNLPQQDSCPLHAPPAPIIHDFALLRVTGVRHVISVLEALDRGQLADVRLVDPWLCDRGCFGSPLLSEDPYLARRRWRASPLPPDPEARAVRRERPLQSRRGLRLDASMDRAMSKLARIDRVRRTLPGADCTMCGAPSCAALAEDIVLGRATRAACVREPVRRAADDAAPDAVRPGGRSDEAPRETTP